MGLNIKAKLDNRKYPLGIEVFDQDQDYKNISFIESRITPFLLKNKFFTFSSCKGYYFTSPDLTYGSVRAISR